LGGAIHFGSFDVGVTGKYFRSQLADTATAATAAADVGVVWPNKSAFRLGASFQNLGGNIKYLSRSFDLPRIARLGASYQMLGSFVTTNFLLDLPYHINPGEIRPAMGIETFLGGLALRVGYRSGSDLEEFSVGTGFMLGGASFDYAFGMVEEFDSRHRVSLSMQFGRVVPRWDYVPDEFVFAYPDKNALSKINAAIDKMHAQDAAPSKGGATPAKTTAIILPGLATYGQRSNGINPATEIYEVKPGDTLKSIARKEFGNQDMWNDILNANRHLGLTEDNIRTGQKILLPKRAN